jgi:hypothetical protein
MKRCSTCNRTYTDPNLSFCIDDGTPLTPVESEDEATVVTPRRSDDDESNAVAYRPPGSYVPPGTEVPRRRVWPWVLGIAGFFILGIVTLGIAAAILAPRLRERQNEQAASNNAKRAENSNTTAEPNSSSDNANESVDAPPPTDHAQVLAQLTDIENEWTAANLNADKKKLDRILADDFVGQGEGELQSKADYIRTIERIGYVDKWEFSDLKLALTGDRATLSGKIAYIVRNEKQVFDFTDKFVWRDGRWQATGAVIAQSE